MTDTVKLAIAVAAAVRRLRRGEAVVGTFRGELVGLLLGIVTVGAGRPAAGATDPGELIRLLVSLCRAAGMSGPEMVSRFNDAVERRD